MKRGAKLRRAVCVLLFVSLFFSAPFLDRASATESGAAKVELTEEEQALVDRGQEIVIGCPVGACPLLFEDEKTGEVKGITVDILEMIAQETGLRFSYQALPSGMIDYETLEKLGVDLVASVELHDMNRQAGGILMTDPYLQTEKVFVCKRGVVLDPEKESVVAVASGSKTLSYFVQEIYPNFRIDYYDTMQEALSALLRGKADAVLENQYTLQRLLAKPRYEGLQVVEAAAISDYHCLAAVVPVDENGQSAADAGDTLLVSVLNKGIAALDQDEIAFLIIKETAENTYHYTMEDFIYRYRHTAAFMVVSVVLILFLLWESAALRKRHEEKKAAEEQARELARVNEKMRENQQLLEEALVRAEAGNRAKSEFLFNMSHDIRTPMNAILGFSNLMMEHQYDKDKIRDIAGKIQGAADNLMHLLNNVLDMSQLEGGRVAVAEKPCDLVETVTEAQDFLREDVERKRLTVNVDTVDVKNRKVYCDVLKLNQILLHLLSNAVKFSKEGGIVNIALHQDESGTEGKAAYRIHVKDNGIGMSEEFRCHVFEAFERERTSTVSGKQGVGLGLPIVKKLAELMGGTIDIASRPNEGTECILRLTLRLQEEAGEKNPAQSEEVPDFTDRRLLLVEDNELNAEIAQTILEEVGFQVEVAENGKAALEMVEGSQPGYYDLVLMDIQMPVMDGYQAARAIRALPKPELAGIPIIALTANALEEDQKKALESGMNAHVAKPIDVPMFLETLKMFC